MEDATVFDGLYEGCQFNIQGMDIENKNIGKIPYNISDNMVPMMNRYASY